MEANLRVQVAPLRNERENFIRDSLARIPVPAVEEDVAEELLIYALGSNI